MVVKTKFADGTPLLIEAEKVEPIANAPDGYRALAGVSTTEKIVASFDNVAGAVKNVAAQLKDALATANPNETTVELKLDLKVDAGALVAMLAKAEGSASLKITLKWKKD